MLGRDSSKYIEFGLNGTERATDNVVLVKLRTFFMNGSSFLLHFSVLNRFIC